MFAGSARSIKAEHSIRPPGRIRGASLRQGLNRVLRWHAVACSRLRNSAIVVVAQSASLVAGQDNDLCSYSDAFVEVHHVGILQPDAAARYMLADRVWIVRAVNAVSRVAEIKGARSQRIAGPTANPA